ncbi:MAG: ice-binding family protein, partial [Paludibacter sp.]|nr:ice-binding family protein [Paludibacter sp.]
SITMAVKNADETALAKDTTWTFSTINVYSLNITALNGSVSKNPDQPTYNSGTNVVLTPTPAPGYSFSSWSGDATGTKNPLTVTMNSAKNITANFTLNSSNFSLNISALNGTVISIPDQLTYVNGTSVELTAVPDPGYTFNSWSGDAIGTNAVVTIIMNGDKNVTANFDAAAAQGPGIVNLGTAADFTILSKTGISTIGVTSITGNIGVSPATATAITGFSLIMDATNQFSTSLYVNGQVFASDYTLAPPSKMTTAISDVETAFTTAMGMTTSVIVDKGAGNISGMTLVPGLYKWSSGLLITNAGVTLSGGPNDTWVFQIAQGLTVDNTAIIHLSGGAQAKNIFWITASDAVIGSDVDFSGNILSQTLISLNTRAKVTGRLLAQSAVTLNTATVVLP